MTLKTVGLIAVGVLVATLIVSNNQLANDNELLRFQLVFEDKLSKAVERVLDANEKVTAHDRDVDAAILSQVQKLRTLPEDSQAYLLSRLPDDIRDVLNGVHKSEDK